jgi:hypothetical protein
MRTGRDKKGIPCLRPSANAEGNRHGHTVTKVYRVGRGGVWV